MVSGDVSEDCGQYADSQRIVKRDGDAMLGRALCCEPQVTACLARGAITDSCQRFRKLRAGNRLLIARRILNAHFPESIRQDAMHSRASSLPRPTEVLLEYSCSKPPDRDLAYFAEGSEHFGDYVEAVSWAQEYAMQNRREMADLVLAALKRHLPAFDVTGEVVNCHHNYVALEHHYGADVWLTRKGAIRARAGDLGIIPGSMGARSFIVRGKGNAESFDSCAHGAGRRMSRTAANKQFSAADLARQTEGVVCRKDKGVVDEIPGAYKDIDTVMANQADLVEVLHTLKQVVCVKG